MMLSQSFSGSSLLINNNWLLHLFDLIPFGAVKLMYGTNRTEWMQEKNKCTHLDNMMGFFFWILSASLTSNPV